MKMKNLAGAFLALAAMFGIATVRAADIYDVHACDRYGVSINPDNLPFYTPDESMGSGVTAYFKVRFLPRQEKGQFSTNLWQFVYTGLSSQNVEQPKIGIFVSGVQTEATYVGMPDTPEVAGTLPTGEAYYFSDLIFAYTTKPGDFALPIVLAAKGGDGRPTPASDVSENISEYFRINQGQNGWKLQFPMYDGGRVQEASWSIAAGVPNLSRLGLDPSLSKAGYCVRTVDFASAWEKPGEAWRVVHQGSTKTEKYEPQLEAKPAAAKAEILYVWSDDESSVVVDGREVTSETEWQSLKEKLSLREPVWMTRNVYLPETGKTKTRRVAMVKIDGGATTGDLTLRGVAQDTSTKLYLSAYDHFNVSDATSDDVVDYVTVPVACSEPLPPSVTVTTSTADAVAGYDYGHAAARITVSLPSADYAASIPSFKVKVTPKLSDGTDISDSKAWGSYVRFSADQQDVGKVLPDPAIPEVTLGGGVESASIFVFCLKGDMHTTGVNVLQFAPSSDDPSRPDILPENYKAGGFNMTAQIPEITEPEEGAKVEGNVYQYDDYSLTIKVEGSYADSLTNGVSSSSPTGYVVRVRYGNGEFEQLPGTYYPGTGNSLTKTGTMTERPVLNFPESGENQTADIEVIAPASGRKSSEPNTVYRRIVADVKKQKTIGVEVTLPRKTEALDTIAEGSQVAFTVHLSDAYSGASAVYAFIQVTNEYVRAGQFDFKAVPPFIVGCTNKAGETVGLEIPRGTTTSVAKQNTVTLLDGYDDLDGGLTLDFNVLLSTEKEWSKAQLKPIKGYSMDGSEYSLTLMVTNVMPSVKSVKLDGTAVKTDPENPTRVAASDTRYQKFEVALEEPSDYDVKNDEPSFYGDEENPGLRLKWEAYLDGEYQAGETLTDFHSKTVTFSNLFQTVGSWEIRIWAKDKDMADFTDDDEPTYSFPLEVVDSPTIVVNGGEERRVNETDARSTVEVELSLWPKEVTGTLVVELSKEIGRTGAKGDWGELELETNRVEFTKSNWNKRQSIRIIRMDGTDNTGLYGWDVKGEAVTVVSAGGAESAAPKLPCVAGRVYVDNVAPNGNDESSSFSPDANTNVWEVAGGAAAAHPLKFFIRTDVDRDFTATATNDDWKVSEGVWTNGIKVTIMGGGGESYDTDGFVKGVKYFSEAGSGTFIPNFGSSQGDQEVTIMIDDKDGGHLSRTWKFTVTPSKYLTTVATGPSGGTSSSALSQKYSGASGLGEGHVFALDKTFTKANDFRLHWNCSKDAKASLYAWGYKVGAVDDGTLDTHDQPLDGTGAAAAGVTPGTYYHYGDPELDSFLYCWIQTVTDEKGAETSSYLGALAPERAAKAGASMAEITLPDMNKDAKDNVYPETVVEAIFAREWLTTDNMGDINQDGIPDLYVNQYKFDVIDETTGAIAEGGKDLKSLRDFNADLDKDGAASPDYLPIGSEAIYGTYIPGLAETWKDVGKEFTALLEIRGYGNGLNDAPALAGITGVKPDRIYEDPDLSPTSTLTKVEFLAWSEYAAAHGLAVGNPADWEMWSPERPTSPLLDDTDGDEFSDGYEYYFWYRAHVGYLDAAGVHRYLTGRAYDPRNPGEGKLIDSATIARIMDPRHDLDPVDFPANYIEDPSSAKTRDTDNDGLPDLLEFEIGTNPFDFDTDGDGLPDGWEIMIAGTDPLSAATYADALSDTERNLDGDAMAISSYALEAAVQPTPANYEHAKRWTFAVEKATGDTDGVQWYAMTAAPELEVEREITTWHRITFLDGVERVCMSETEPVVTEDGRLAADIRAYTVVTYTPVATEEAPAPTEELVRGYPVRIPAGTPVAVAASTESLKVYKVKTAVEAKDANACWIYGKGTAATRYGETATASTKGYGFLALARQLAVDADAVICAVPSEGRDVAFLHFLCYQEFGFDPRTAWKAKDPLAVRWSKNINGESVEGITQLQQGGHTGKPTRTRDYANYDEFLVCSFFICNCPEGEPLNYVTYVLDEKAPEWAKAWGALTTNPQGPTDAPLVNPEHYYGRNSTNGADTDLDGVPDGWELYVMAGPKCNGAYVFAPPYDGFETAFTLPFADPATGVSPYRPGKSFWSPFVDSADTTDTSNQIYLGGEANDDLLNEYQEFEGTDTMNYYADFSETVVHKGAWQWINKFFPTDPWNVDTDGDGVSDGNEGKNFVYGSPADDGKRRWAAGGGLNPCSVDTDLDGLPDGWELQFKGTPDSLYKGSDADYAKDADGNPVGNALQGLTDGMDGTVADAFNYPPGTATEGGAIKQVVDRDYDHDGLDNWQEYMTGMMRCWRYDDPVSPLTYIPRSVYFTVDEEGNETFDAEGAAKRLNAAGILETDDVNEFWYRTLVDAKSPAYNPHFVFDTGSGAQYLSRVTNGWDVAYYDAELSQGKVSGAYYWFVNRVDGTKLVDSWGAAWTARLEADGTVLSGSLGIVPGKYPSCSPIDPDSDHDGMDDRYEVFHGLNPLLGRSGEVGSWWSVNQSGMKNDSEGIDIVYDALGGGLAPQAWGTDDSEKSFRNYWQRQVADASYAGPKPRGTGFDFTVFPWLNGLATADADGDGMRNQEEAIMPLIAPTAVWHHTDPTPLWMTDSSYSNSLVRRSYRMPVRTDEIPVPESFTYDGREYLLREFDGYLSDMKGTRLIAFNPDRWSLTGGANAMNWMFSFEENEGFDTDHDGIGDQDEVGGKYRTATDPLDADSPRRRQAMYFQGRTRPSILQTMPFVREAHPWAMTFGKYPDDMSFLQYTVECWVKADSLEDSTVIERAAWTDQSSPADKEFVRCNFRLGIKGGKWYTKYDPNDTTRNAVEVFSDVPATTEWTHLAATYDAKTLRLYVNGALHGSLDSGLQPSYGSSAVAVDGFSGVHAPPGMTYWKDREYELNAIVLGGSVKTCAQGATDGGAFDVTRGIGWSGYDPDAFFKGYVDEVRVWDGARTGDEIKGAMKTRFTAAEAEANRKAFYDEWSQYGAADRYRGRYAKDGSGNAYPLPAELRFHWTFDSVFGAAGEEMVAKAPAGFNYDGEDSQGGRAKLSRPDGYGIAWWQKVLEGYTGTVYSDPAWIEWIPDTVAHLPRFDGTTLDSRYWSLDFAGDEVGTYSFARTAEPVSFWTQFRYGGVSDGSPAYCAESSRHYFADKYDATNGTAFATLYEFTGRHLNQTGDDLLPLGGAYVKHVDDMWDAQGSSSNWEISGDDDDGDGLPNWWEDWAEDHYRDDAVTAYGTIDWNTIVIWPDQNGLHMTAGEAYLRDLARGYHADADGYLVDDMSDGDFRQRYDLDGNGMPDWWADMYGITGESGLDDHDNDGLPNYVEYLLSEVFAFQGVLFDPTRFDSANPGIPDYFYKVGELYVGEIFTDHDLVDDAWEDLYGTGFASRRVYDAAKDADNDGWSNRSEVRYSKQVMPIVADQVSHYTSADGLTADYPIPTIALTLHYNGAKSDAVEKAPIIVQMTTERKLERAFEAVYKIAGTVSETTGEGRSASTGRSSKDDGNDTSTAYTRSLGKWSNRHALGTLTPGYINQNSVKLEYCYDPSAEIYSWTVRHYYYQNEGSSSWYDEDKRGTRSEFDADKRKYGDANVTLMSRDTEYRELVNVRLRTDENSKTAFWEHTSTGERFGTLDLVSGAFDIDFGVFKGQYVVNGTNANDRASLEDQTYRIAYSVNPAVGLPRKLYLGEATTGHVREGRNTIIAFADLDGNGSYTAGEPYGCVTDVDVSWKGTEASIELTEVSAVCPRMNIADGTSDREFTWGTESGYWTNHIVGVLNGGTKTRVRVIRSLVNTYAIEAINKQIDSKVTLGQLNRIVLDKYVDLTVNPLITEADFFAAGELDIDWSTLRADIPQNIWDAFKSNPLWGEIVRFDYRVVLGEGTIDLEEVNNLHKVMFSRVFDDEGGRKLNIPVPIAPGPTEESTLTVARPTFRWKLPGNTASTVCSYPAFRIVVSNMTGAVVYDSGIQRTPALNRNYEYEWAAPISVGDRTPSGKVFENNSAYSWQVSMYNCKFKTDLFSAVGDFYVNVTTNGYDCGHVDAAVKYFGPKDAASGKIVRVRAYTSPDFTGTPVAGGFIDLSAAANMTSLTNDAVNCRIIGLPKGSYYLQAFIDSNTNGVCDVWESMGYLCSRDGSTADYLNPTAVTFADKVGFGDTAWIYIEDADTDGDGLPDAWEFAKKGNLTVEGVKSLTPSAAGELALNTNLVGNLLMEVNRDAIPTAGIAADILHTLSASRDIAALVMGVEPASLRMTPAGVEFGEHAVEGTVVISGFSVDPLAGELVLKVSAETVAPEGAEDPTGIYRVTVGSGVTVDVYRTDAVSGGEWTLVDTVENVKVTPAGTDLRVRSEAVDANGAFFKIVIR